MKVEERFVKRFEQLIENAKEILSKSLPVEFYGNYVDRESSFQFATSSQSLIKNIFGQHSSHLNSFDLCFQSFSSATQNDYQPLSEMLGVLKAAKDDYENGYLFDTRTLIEAEIFDDLLEQSEHLLSQGYFQSSAVIAGSVLGDALRKLCIKNNITLPAKPKMDSMNSELAKANVYNLLKQKQITALADLRNKAAHNQGGFTKEDVEDMIRNVRRFMEDFKWNTCVCGTRVENAETRTK